MNKRTYSCGLDAVLAVLAANGNSLSFGILPRSPAISLRRSPRRWGRASSRCRVVDDPNTFRAAKLLMEQHGEDAGLRVAQRAEELLEKGVGAMAAEPGA
jgi:hypothetical protein